MDERTGFSNRIDLNQSLTRGFNRSQSEIVAGC